MTDSDNSYPQDDSDEDIYKDFADFNFGDELAKLEGSNKAFKQEAIDLSEKVKALTQENEELKKLNETLGKNLSTLLKTAQAEVKRKDCMIEELRSKVDSFTFRRNNKITKDKFTSTDDLEIVVDFNRDTRESKSSKDKKRSKSRTSSDSERKSIQDDEKKGDFDEGQLQNTGCDRERRLGYRENVKSNFRHSGSQSERGNDRYKGSWCKLDRPDYRKSFRHDRRDHLKYDSFDKRRHSRRSPPRSRHSSRSDRREDSIERRRRSTSRKEKGKSRSRGRFTPPKESDAVVKKPSLPGEATTDVKEVPNHKAKAAESARSGVKGEESRTLVKGQLENASKKASRKSDKGCGGFGMMSPLDALYSEAIASRSSTRFSSSSRGTPQPESELEEGEYVEETCEKVVQIQAEEEEEEEEKEDWTLSFKNERKNETKPVTLYSKRMMQKLTEPKKEDRKRLNEEENEKEGNFRESPEKTNSKARESDKEPGELTDDENVVESSKEFQEIAKVASIESLMNDKPVKVGREDGKKGERDLFKEPYRIEGPKKVSVGKSEGKTMTLRLGESVGQVNEVFQRDVEGAKEFRDVIEFSPFKNNYKLIEISPVKPPDQHVLDFYCKRQNQTQKEMEASVFNLLSTLSGVPINKDQKTEEGEKKKEGNGEETAEWGERVEKENRRKENSSGNQEVDAEHGGKETRKNETGIRSWNDEEGAENERREKHSKENRKRTSKDREESVKTDRKESGRKEGRGKKEGEDCVKTERRSHSKVGRKVTAKDKEEENGKGAENRIDDQKPKSKGLFKCREEGAKRERKESYTKESRSGDVKTKNISREGEEAGDRKENKRSSSRKVKSPPGKYKTEKKKERQSEVKQKVKTSPRKDESVVNKTPVDAFLDFDVVVDDAEKGAKGEETMEILNSSEGKSESEGNASGTSSGRNHTWKNSSSEKESEEALPEEKEEENCGKPQPKEFETQRKDEREQTQESKNKRTPKEDGKRNHKRDSGDEKTQVESKTDEKESLPRGNQKGDGGGRGKRRVALKTISEVPSRKRKRSEGEKEEVKKHKGEDSPRRITRSQRESKNEPETKSEGDEKPKEDITCFEFFKPITKEDCQKEGDLSVCSSTVTTTMSLTEVILETPNKWGEKVKNLMMNEQTVYQPSLFSPIVGGSKSIEMTPRRMLKNDLTLTDSEDEPSPKGNEEVDEEEDGSDEDEENDDDDDSDSDSDSGASDFVDLL